MLLPSFFLNLILISTCFALFSVWPPLPFISFEQQPGSSAFFSDSLSLSPPSIFLRDNYSSLSGLLPSSTDHFSRNVFPTKVLANLCQGFILLWAISVFSFLDYKHSFQTVDNMIVGYSESTYDSIVFFLKTTPASSSWELSMFSQLKSRLPWYIFPRLLSWENTHSMICLYKSDQAVISERKLCRKSSWWICKYTFDGFSVQELGQRHDWYFYQWKN